MRIDRFMSLQAGVSRRDVKLMLAQKRITIDGVVAQDSQHVIDAFSHVRFDNQILQDNTPRYVMMNKPVGVVSATKDEQHQTVIDLLDGDDRSGLHIVGRLDLNSSGLLLLTNDSRWSRRLMDPKNKVTKVYRVTLEKPLTDEYISAFADGMYFGYEDITTQPAKLKIVSEYVAEVSLVEGRYHQIKRMFGRFRNPVLALHRERIGQLLLDPELKPGGSRALSQDEACQIS
ncbi:pseudouridine synthase [Alkalimarinus alittae]|uniref:Pseudouridine synthase n=1 Tax=Alkalimarinus alittae TaxID=2961619 RepID=A0ABY6N7G9_9ALTE|nr:16S rRNA pseudouridine(516) synthase [Alkalimarinus alittae]UZE98066.1 pseudouridine synthase [Alkalimarinus alittae]